MSHSTQQKQLLVLLTNELADFIELDYSPLVQDDNSNKVTLLQELELQAANLANAADLAGLVGFNMFGKTVGIIGTGKIGLATIKILQGFGCKVLAYDPYPNPLVLELGVEYVSLDEIYPVCDIISLHCPLTAENHHLLNQQSFNKMKAGVMVINTSRGGLLNAIDAMEALKEGQLGSLGLDVYENEKGLFFEDKSSEIIQDDVFRRLSACHNVIFTGHQAFLTEEALNAIALTTLNNVQALALGEKSGNELC